MNITLAVFWGLWSIQAKKLKTNVLIEAEPSIFEKEIKFLELYFMVISIILWVLILVGLCFNNCMLLNAKPAKPEDEHGHDKASGH